MPDPEPPGERGEIEPIPFRPRPGQRVNLWIRGENGRRWCEPVEVDRVWWCGEGTLGGAPIVYGEAKVRSVVGRGHPGMTAAWYEKEYDR